jgi:hypothetical protein
MKSDALSAQTKPCMLWGLPLYYVPVDSMPRRSLIARIRRAIAWDCRWMLVRELLLELRSLLRRIRMIVFRGRVRVLDLGPEYGLHRETGHLVECSRTRGRRTCMRSIRAEAVRLSVEDRYLVLKGFELGSEWAYSNPHFCRPQGESSDDGRIPCSIDLSKFRKGSWF